MVSKIISGGQNERFVILEQRSDMWHERDGFCSHYNSLIPSSLALDLATNLAKVGETFEVVAESRFGYGTLGRPPHIKPGCSVLLIVEVLQSEDTPEISEMTEPERVRIG